MKKFFFTLMMVFVLTFLTACAGNGAQPDTSESVSNNDGGDSDQGSEQVVFKLAHAGASEDVMNKAALKFSEIVEKETKGRVKIEVFGTSQLGNERDIAEGIQLGTIGMGLVSNGSISGFVPMAGLWDLPYLFRDLDHAHAVANGPIGDKLKEKMTKKGLYVLAINDGGFRHITNSRGPIKSLDDLDGIKIRVMESAIMKATFDAIPGMSATPLAFGELYSALEQGVVDAQENPLTLIESMKFYEVQDYLSLTGHFYYPRYFLVNTEKFKKLSEEDQQIVLDAAKEASIYNNETNVSLKEELLTKLKEHGMNINEVSEEFKKNFKAIMEEKVYPEFYDDIGGTKEKGKQIIEEITNTK